MVVASIYRICWAINPVRIVRARRARRLRWERSATYQVMFNPHMTIGARHIRVPHLREQYPSMVPVITKHARLDAPAVVPSPVLGMATLLRFEDGVGATYSMPWAAREAEVAASSADWSPGWRNVHGEGLVLTELCLVAERPLFIPKEAML